MASGDTLLFFHPYNNEPPYTGGRATFDVHNGHPVLDFDDDNDEAAIFSAIWPRNYAGGGVTVTLVWAAFSATSGDVVWTAAFERIGDGQQDLSLDGFATVQSATDAAPVSADLTTVSTIAFSDGAEMDSIVNGELFRLRIARDADNAADSMSGDAELLGVEIRET